MPSMSPRILIAEDDPFLQKVFAAELAKAGFSVLTAQDGDTALRMMHDEKPSLLLLDMLMPGKNGFAVLEERSRQPELQAIPVIILSSLGQEDDVARAMKLGASDYFLKSNTDLEKLVGLMKQAMKATT